MEAVAAEAAEAEAVPAAAGEEAEAAAEVTKTPLAGDALTKTDWGMLKDAMDGTTSSPVDGLFEVSYEEGTGIKILKLLKDITAASSDTYLSVPDNSRLILDLNGKTLDRGLKEEDAVSGGNVIRAGEGVSLTIKNGTITGSHPTNAIGKGALRCEKTTKLNLNNVRFVDCTNVALFLNGVNSTNIEGCLFSGNTYGGNNVGGAAIDVGNTDEQQITQRITIENCSFENNVITGGSGSAIHLYVKTGNIDTTIKGSTFTGNRAESVESDDDGGVICAYSGSLELDGCTITGNTAAIEPKNNNCGGVSVSKNVKSFIIKGKTVIKDNTCGGEPADLCLQNNGAKFKAEDLNPEAKIGVKALYGFTGTSVIAEEFKASDIKCFFPDDPMYQLTATGGKLYIEPAENHVDIEYKKAGEEESKHFSKYGVAAIGGINIPEMLLEGDKDAAIIGVKAEGNVEVNVNGKVDDPDSEDGAKGVTASGSAKVTITGDVKNTLDNAGTADTDNAVNAYDQAVVKIGGSVDSKNGDAIYANGPAAVTVDGTVTTHSDSGVIAKNNATVEIKGNINSADYGIVAADSNVTVFGDITSDAAAICAAGTSTVKVGGNVAASSAIEVSGDKATVVVEGTVSGDICTEGGKVFVGKLDGKMEPGTEDYVCYLIGFADGAAGLKEFNFSGVEGAPTGVNGKVYNAVSANQIAGSQITITPKEAGKKIDTSKLQLPAGVTKVEENGALILKFDENFKGGLQDMMITIDGPKPDPTPSSDDSREPLFTGNWTNPVKNGSWTQDANGIWSYTSTEVFRNTWGYIANPYAQEGQHQADWFFFDQYGHMLTGWQLINGKWYYLNPTKDGTLGACFIGPGKTPDGWEIDETGAWTGR